jgi:multicomponent Na+:H+ antiporter subunit C
MGGDPVPQALLITAIVVAFAASALAVALILRLFGETGVCSLSMSSDAAPVRSPAEGDEL